MLDQHHLIARHGQQQSVKLVGHAGIGAGAVGRVDHQPVCTVVAGLGGKRCGVDRWGCSIGDGGVYVQVARCGFGDHRGSAGGGVVAESGLHNPPVSRGLVLRVKCVVAHLVAACSFAADMYHMYQRAGAIGGPSVIPDADIAGILVVAVAQQGCGAPRGAAVNGFAPGDRAGGIHKENIAGLAVYKHAVGAGSVLADGCKQVGVNEGFSMRFGRLSGGKSGNDQQQAGEPDPG